MGQKHIAVIDCGTNTFTLSLFKINADNTFNRIEKKRHYVELAEEGILEIGPKAFERGLEAFRAFKIYLEAYPNVDVQALGTAALRRASNGPAFVEKVKAISGIEIQIIDGDREAFLIYSGVKLAAPLSLRPSLIMDIGGGSVEFIIANNQQLFWAKSYPIGGAVLYNDFHKSDPILSSEIQNLQTYLNNLLVELSTLLEKYDIEYLIGASGSFDVLDNLVGIKNTNESFGTISSKDFQMLYKQLVPATFEERLNIKNLVQTRAKLIVMSVLLIDFIHKKINTTLLIASDHAMREGVIAQLLAAN